VKIQVEVLPKSPAGRAVRYTLKNWMALTRYCEDGDIEIDNNATERAIRGVAVGRNNWMFFGSDEGGKTAAVLRSFVASCQRVGVDHSSGSEIFSPASPAIPLPGSPNSPT
jgi:transposase